MNEISVVRRGGHSARYLLPFLLAASYLALARISTAPKAGAAFAETAAVSLPSAPVAVKITVGGPGVYGIDVAVIESHGLYLRGTPSTALQLSGRGRSLPVWFEEDAPAGAQLRFLADQALFRPDGLRDAAPLRVLELSVRPGPPTARTASSGSTRRQEYPAQSKEELPVARVVRRVLLEENRIRASVPLGDADVVKTLWYWAMLSNLTSSALEVDLSFLDGRSVDETELRLALHVLGWSRTNVPDGMAQHQLDVSLDTRTLASASWDGRAARSLEFEFPRAAVSSEQANLRITIPNRVPPGAAEPLVDVSYVDRLEVTYRPRSPLVDNTAPLLVRTSDAARFLPDPKGHSSTFVVSSAGWTLPRNAEGGWILPPTDGGQEVQELWVFDEESLGTPLAVEVSRRGQIDVPVDVEYLIMAPPGLVEGAEALAEVHRERGLRVGVVDAEAVYDQFGGEPRVEHLRTFLQWQAERSDRLRLVLLVGDADWFEPDDLQPPSLRSPVERNRIPSWTFLSRYGMGASDHYFTVPLDVADPSEEASPRFAIGRLPVQHPDALAAYVGKVARRLATRRLEATWPTAVFLSDAGPGSILRQERLLRRLEDLPIIVETPLAELRGRQPDQAMIDALAEAPDLVYFGGHGSRHTFHLGDPGSPSPETFFDREDVARTAPSDRLPLVLAVSCATAPFDHPQADSLGEAMVLSAERGAMAFVGASAALSTPWTLAEGWVRSWLTEETVGGAFVAAKRRADRAHASHLYNLLGDPALPAQGPERGAGQQ